MIEDDNNESIQMYDHNHINPFLVQREIIES